MADPAAEVNWGGVLEGRKGGGYDHGRVLPCPPPKKKHFEQMKQNIVLSLPGIFYLGPGGGGGGGGGSVGVVLYL